MNVRDCMLRSAGIAMVGVLVGTAPAAGASKTASKDVEDALRARVQQFYQLLLEHKYRAAEDLVAPESRDTYYAEEKPELEDFKVTGIAWADNFVTADLTMVSKVKMRSVRLGAFEENVPYASHWKFENGQWFWYLPRVTVRATPFGVMKVNPDVAEKSNVDLKSMIAKGPTAKTVQQGVDADRASVQLIGNKPQEVKIENKLPGRVTLRAQIVSGTGFDASLHDSDLAGNGKTRLVISRRRGVDFKPGKLAVLVQPTGQVLQITVE